jgi:uncharacterized protein (TIGR02466 family)
MTPPDSLRVRAAQLGLFETPVLQGEVVDSAPLCAALARAITDRRASAPTIGRSNVGGWHSATDMLQWGGSPAAQLADLALRMVRRISALDDRDIDTLAWDVRMWANVSPPGALNMSHAHPGVLWAAVFYVDMGDPPAGGDAGGELYFEDPRFPVPQARMPGFRIKGLDGEPQPVERRIPTRAGQMVIFPAWLRHGVRPHKGTRDRISIAMNIDAKNA